MYYILLGAAMLFCLWAWGAANRKLFGDLLSPFNLLLFAWVGPLFLRGIGLSNYERPWGLDVGLILIWVTFCLTATSLLAKPLLRGSKVAAQRIVFQETIRTFQNRVVLILMLAVFARCIPDKIREKTGRVFHSTTPDVFMSLAVPVFSPKAYDVGFCVTLHGVSQKSNSGAKISKNGVANVERFIREYGDYKIHPSLFPDFPLIANLISDGVLVAMGMFPEFYRGMKFNYDAMVAFYLRLQPSYRYDLSWWQVVRKRDQIRRYHPFHLDRFLLFSVFQEGAHLRRNLLQKMMKLRPLEGSVPENIRDFAKKLADLQETEGQQPRRT
jgi:hypothetical protein